MSDAGPLCLGCTDLDHLVFLAAGDAALTRRARAASRLSAVVRFSRACGRYERQGALVDEAALEEAEARVPGRRAGLPLPAARARLGPRRAPITPADVQRTLAAQSTLLEALDLIDTGGPAWVVGSSADTLLPGATLLAGVYTWYDDHEDQQTWTRPSTPNATASLGAIHTTRGMTGCLDVPSSRERLGRAAFMLQLARRGGVFR